MRNEPLDRDNESPLPSDLPPIEPFGLAILGGMLVLLLAMLVNASMTLARAPEPRQLPHVERPR